MTKVCDRCGVDEHNTDEGVLAYNGSQLVCADCDGDINNEWVADTGAIHPLDALNPRAHFHWVKA